MFANTNATRSFRDVYRKSILLYSKRAFVHWFMNEGMEIRRFEDSFSEITLFESSFEEVGMRYFECEEEEEDL